MTLTWKETLYNLLLKHLNFMRSLSEEEADKFVMKHHKHGAKKNGGEEKNRGRERANEKQSRQRTEQVSCELDRDWTESKRMERINS